MNRLTEKDVFIYDDDGSPVGERHFCPACESDYVRWLRPHPNGKPDALWLPGMEDVAALLCGHCIELVETMYGKDFMTHLLEQPTPRKLFAFAQMAYERVVVMSGTVPPRRRLKVVPGGRK